MFQHVSTSFNQTAQEPSWLSTWLARYFGKLPPYDFSRGGLCTQSLLTVLKANAADRGWRSLEIGGLLRQIGSLLNRQREDAGVS